METCAIHLASCERDSVRKSYVYPHGFTEIWVMKCEGVMRLPTEWANRVSCETSEGGQKHIL